MFITPHVLTGQDDLDRMTAEKKNQMQEALQGLQPQKAQPDS